MSVGQCGLPCRHLDLTARVWCDAARARRYLWYRLVVNDPALAKHMGDGSRMLLHFDAVDWQTTVYWNKQVVGNHTGGCVRD